jgi:tetratricopeptide (TPR) repeat protein
LILTDRTLIEDYDSLCEMTIDSDSFIALANLLLDKKDYDRAEQFYLKDPELENDIGLHQVKILNKLSQLFAKKNQFDKAKKYYQQANAIKQQYSSK